MSNAKWKANLAMKTVLFAWEQGGGFGHIANLGRFAALLKHHDIRPVFALKHPEAASYIGMGLEFAGADINVPLDFHPRAREFYLQHR